MNIKSIIPYLVALFFCGSCFAKSSRSQFLTRVKELNQNRNGCTRIINGIRCGSPRYEGGRYCYNCKQIIDREKEQKPGTLKNRQERLNEARRNLNLQKQAQQAELDRMSSRIWFVNFETLQEKHDRIMAKKPAPKFPVDGLGD